MSRERETRFEAICIAYGAGALALAALLAVLGPLPPLAPVLTFAALAIWAESLEVPMRSGQVGFAPGDLVRLASVIVFRNSAPLLGPLVVGMSGAFFRIPRTRRHWCVLGANFGSLGLPAVAAAIVLAGAQHVVTLTPGWLVLVSVPMVLADIATNGSLLAVYFAVQTGESAARLASTELRDNAPRSTFVAFIGVFVGWLFVAFGLTMLPLVIGGLLVARLVFSRVVGLQRARDDTVEAFLVALDAKDGYTAAHSRRVASLARYQGEQFALSEVELERLRLHALMHDIGKLVVANHILNKPGRLTDDEWEEMKRHEAAGFDMLSRVSFLRVAAPSTTAEHTQYREGVDDGGRPSDPNIVHVADAFDAMATTRSYRKAKAQPEVFAEMRRFAGTQFNPECVEALITAIESRGETYGSGHETEAHGFDVEPPEGEFGSAGLGLRATHPGAASPPERGS